MGASEVLLNGIQCSSLGDCVAVGAADVKTAVPLLETETAGSWVASTSAIAPPLGAAGKNGELLSVWCASYGNCVAFGLYEAGKSSIGAMAALETSGVWARAVGVADGKFAGGFVIPESLACSDVSNCTAIGIGLTSILSGALSTIEWTESAGVWRAAKALPYSKGHEFVGLTVACPTASTCFVGGIDEHGSKHVVDPAIAVESSNSWSVPRLLYLPRLSPVTTGGFITSLSCGSSTTCEAVGELELPSSCSGPGSVCISVSSSSQLSDALRARMSFRRTTDNASSATLTISGGASFAATWANGAWSSIGVLHGTKVGAKPAASSSLDAVACPSPVECLALGDNSVVVKNSVLSSPFSANLLTVRTTSVPSRPMTVRVAAKPRGALISWLPPSNDGGSPITRFTATVSPGGTQCRIASYFCRVGGLVNGHRYRVAVRDITYAGISDPTVSESFLVGAVPTPPRDLRPSVKGSEVRITWASSTSSTGERITSYKVDVFRGFTTLARVCRTAQRHCTFAHLPKGDYFVEVVASDASGDSPLATSGFIIRK
jgi:hypothetical protein